VTMTLRNASGATVATATRSLSITN
jgi:hypothetical protein